MSSDHLFDFPSLLNDSTVERVVRNLEVTSPLLKSSGLPVNREHPQSRINRALNRTPYGPSAMNTLEKFAVSNSEFRAQIQSAQSLPMMPYAHVRPPIPGLLSIGCPSAISRRIVPAKVRETVNRMVARRPRSHVRKEALKGRQSASASAPPLTASYADSSILRIESRIWVEAAVQNTPPAIIFRRPSPTRCVTVPT